MTAYLHKKIEPLARKFEPKLFENRENKDISYIKQCKLDY